MEYSSKAIGDAIIKNIKTFAQQAYALQTNRPLEFEDKSIRDTEYNLLYLANAIKVESPGLFRNYVEWFVDVLNNIGISKHHLADNFLNIGKVIQDNFEENANEVVQDYIGLAIDIINGQLVETTEDLSSTNKLTFFKDQYVNCLVTGNRRAANELVQRLFKEGYSLQDLYIEIFQQSQYDIGKLWQTNEITIAQEHFCTASTQMIMGQFYPQIFSTPKNDYVFVGACVGGELHELGMRMVSDFMELNGWHTYYLGANMPIKDIVRSVEEERADVLGLSVTMLFHLEHVVEAIQLVRSNPNLSHVKILVGGYPFIMDPDLWKRIGADGFAKDATGAVKLAGELMGMEGIND